MLGDISAVDDIYIVCGYTDMRKQIDGLYSIVKNQFHMDPEQRALYLFCGRRCDRIKALLYENDGFVLLYKRLTDSEGRYCWPRNKNEVSIPQRSAYSRFNSFGGYLFTSRLVSTVS